MRKAEPLTEEQYAEIVEQCAIEACLDLGNVSVLTVTQEGREFYLLSTTNGTYAQLH
jgi:hypothetical protein